MLVAYGPDAQPIVAEEKNLEQLQHWSRERELYCPNCRGIVHLRGGPEKRTQLHFAHQKGECAWSTETESVRHASGKRVLVQWLQEQFPQAHVTLEERLPEPNRIADIFVRHPQNIHWAVEFQCAPLDIEEWKHRHSAYRKAGIVDTWIIGNNRYEKQEAFIEAILSNTREIMFLDPLVTPPRAWLRWPITRSQAQTVQERQHITTPASPMMNGWVGRTGYGMTIMSSLSEIQLSTQAKLIHPTRTAMESRAQLLQAMSDATQPDDAQLAAYMKHSVTEAELHTILLPLLRAYLLDPELLRRYNYNRGLSNHPLNEADRQRVHNARQWLIKLAQKGYTREKLQELIGSLPYIGVYAAFASYAEILLAISL